MFKILCPWKQSLCVFYGYVRAHERYIIQEKPFDDKFMCLYVPTNKWDFNFTAMGMKTAAFWDVAPCSLVDTDRRFGGASCLRHLISLTISSLEDSPTFLS
jgi:hypothetical protein